MKPKILLLFFAFIIAFTFTFVHGQQKNEQGKLFIIGGGSRTESLVKQLIQTAALRPGDHIAILPMSSAEPDSSFYYIKSDLEKACSNTIAYLNFTSATANDQAMLDSVKRARLVFITGGDQTRFMKIVGKGPIYQAIHYAYAHGSTISGTSAGAAVMSKQMITGNQRKDTIYHETIGKLLADNIEITEGLGLVQNVIIDQHFIVRSRYNRLISALHDYPGFLGIGIDESTAIIVDRKQIRVVGESQVLVFSTKSKMGNTSKGLITFGNLNIKGYAAGASFQLK